MIIVIYWARESSTREI